MSKGRRLVAFDEEVSSPREAVGDGDPKQRPPGMPQHEGGDHDGKSQARAEGMKQAVHGIAVLLDVEGEELFVGRKFRGFYFWHRALSGRCEISYLRAGTHEEVILHDYVVCRPRFPMFMITPCSHISKGVPMKVGILTGGGDCPGLNAVIRGVVRKGIFHYQDEFVGFLEGWRGVVEDVSTPLDLNAVAGILPRGGTILRTSRTNPAKKAGGIDACIATLKRHNIEALIAIGGDDTLSVAVKLNERGIHVVGVPKTIDNDLTGTDFCFGFDTAVNIATEAIDRLHTTAEAHNRVIVVEVMGRNSGWIAVYSGVAGGADEILIPEKSFNLDEVAEALKRRHARGRYFSIVVVAEGVKPPDNIGADGSQVVSSAGKDDFGHVRLGGIGNLLARELERRTGFESRAVVLGHIQRGGSPTAFDRMLATRYGIGAVDAVHRADFGKMVALRGTDIITVPLSEATSRTRVVGQDLIDVALGLHDRSSLAAGGVSQSTSTKLK
jgi:phosphofructokinase-like protein